MSAFGFRGFAAYFDPSNKKHEQKSWIEPQGLYVTTDDSYFTIDLGEMLADTGDQALLHCLHEAAVWQEARRDREEFQLVAVWHEVEN